MTGPAPWSSDSLWMKSRLFINRALDRAEYGDFDEQALWASLALEVLAKAALAQVSPVLIASPSEEGTNLLIASGLVAGEATFISVPAKTIFMRCKRVFRPFDDGEAQKFAAGRNEYLHGGSATITTLPPDVWWSRYWRQASILLTAQDRSVEEFVGVDRVAEVERHLERNNSYLSERVESLIARSRQRLALHDSGQLSSREAARWASTTDLNLHLAHHVDATCPACDAVGRLEGNDVLEYEVQYERIDEDDYDSWVDLTVGSDYFSCPVCHLVLDSLDLLTEAGLDDSFPATGDPSEYVEQEYGND
ncbi:MAG: hypothetical protein ABIQ09_20555 [Jatrophihabitantaceae bacterium]